MSAKKDLAYRFIPFLVSCVLFTGAASSSFAQDMPAHDHTAMQAAAASSATANDSFFGQLLKTYIPRRICMNYESDVIWLNLISDALIAISYFTIPLALIYFVRRRKDLAFNWIFVAFAVFILACGATHVFSVIAIWNPVYRLDGLVKAITAAASIVTAVGLWHLIPQAIAIPSVGQLRLVNESLEAEVNDRKQAEESLQKMHDQLEIRVRERTAELQLANQKLVTEIEARKALQLTQARLAAIVESSADTIVGKTLDGIITTWNPAARQLFGYTADEIVGKSILVIVPPERQAEELQILQRVRNGERIEHFETIRVAKDGHSIEVSLSVSPIKDEQGRIVGASKMARDITLQKQRERERTQLMASERFARGEAERLTRMQEELRAVNDELVHSRAAADAANQAKSDFLANMSHEIRTPMSAVIGYADLLLDPRQSPNEQLEYVRIIRRNGEHLLNLINDALDLAKIEAGKFEVQQIECSPCQLLSDVLSLMRVRAAEKKIALEVKNEGLVPLMIRSDPARLRQILINLVGNAIKFTPQGSVHVTMKLEEPASSAPTLRFDVRDTGIGMSRDQIDRLFQPFVQGDNSLTRRFGGTGLGLTICKRFAEMLGGRISVESSPGRGSTFSLIVQTGPLQGVRMLRHCGEALASSERHPGVQSSVKIKGSILLVEDGEDNRNLLSVYLRAAGGQVTLAENGRIGCEKALAAAAEGKAFDLILMDMQMPELDGYGAASHLRAKGYPGPIVALTAHAMADDRAKCLKAGCTDYLSKPVRREDLLAKVVIYLGTETEAAAGGSSGITATDFPTMNVNREVIRSDLGDESLRPLLISYLNQLPGIIREIEHSLAAGDLEKLSEKAHNLAGTGGTFGLMPITFAAAKIEAHIDNQASLDAIRSAVDELIGIIRRVDGFSAS